MELNLKKLKELCFKRKITLKQLSEKTGISQTALTMAMHRNSTTIETFKTLAEFFNVPMEYFYQEGSADIYDSLSLYIEVRRNLVNQLWNCPPSLNEAMDYYITNLYEVQIKITELLNKHTQDEKTNKNSQTTIQPE